MRVTFVLPGYTPIPVGGTKVVYEYAGRLQTRGHQVAIVHPWRVEPAVGVRQRFWSHLWPHALAALHRPLVPWFPVSPAVELLLVPNLQPARIPAADVIIATSWKTAERTAQFPLDKGRKFYLVHDYEYWMTADQETRRRMALTFHAGLRMIATSPSVRAMLRANSASATADVDHGIDFDVFGVDVPIAVRQWGTVGFPVRSAPFKGTSDAVEALRLVRESHGSRVGVTAFGSIPRPELPPWVKYIQSPSDLELRRFYNSISVFVFPSHYEGLGLPGLEAMACGAALVSADAVGNRDYARDGETALVVPRQRPDLLAMSIIRLLDDRSLRTRLAQAGHSDVQRYTWAGAADTMERILYGGSSAAAGRSR